MRIGTKSLLYGSHQFLIHPIFVWIAWRRLYKTRPPYPAIVAFVVHDWGYWGCPNMDGLEGIGHPERGAKMMYRWFDRGARLDHPDRVPFWFNFTAGHSRSYAKQMGIQTSVLMNADKLATHLYPLWLYALMVWLTGEYIEYRDRWIESDRHRETPSYPGTPTDGARAYCRAIQKDWERFAHADAHAGTAFGGE